MLNIGLHPKRKCRSRIIQGHISDGRWTQRGLPLFKDQRKGREPSGAFFSHESRRTARCVALPGIAADVVKCQLKPLSAGDYGVAFTPAQWARLQAIYPAGVCDWSKPGVEQQGLEGTWLDF